MSDTQYGESYTRPALPDEVFQRIMRRADAEQNKHVNTARIADALSEFKGSGADLKDISTYLGRIADALDRAFPEPGTDDGVERNEAGLPVPPWIGDRSGIDHDDTTDADWKPAE